MLSIRPNDRITYKVCHRDDDLLIVAKPAGVVTLPGKGHDDDSLLNGVFASEGTRLQKLGKDREFGLLHRLDRETSGLVMIALTIRGYEGVRALFEERAIAKFYLAITSQHPPKQEGVINKPIAEYEKRLGYGNSQRLARVHGAGKASRTAYRTLSTSTTATLLECRAITGRLHQVRVHLAAIGCPIVGDGLYAPSGVAGAGKRLALHAHRLVLQHPFSGERLDVRTPPMKDFLGLMRSLRLTMPEAGAQGETV